MRVLVTSATGFIGGHLVRALIESGHHCKCLIRILKCGDARNLAYKIVNFLFNSRVALLGTFIFSISPLQIYLSQEARTYSLVTFLCLVSIFLFIKFIKNSRVVYLIGYIIVSFLSIYSHCFVFFILMAQKENLRKMSAKDIIIFKRERDGNLSVR